MKCGKCGAEVPETSGFCASCGNLAGSNDNQTQGQFSQWWAGTAALLGRDPVVIIVGIGTLLLVLGPFLSWASVFGPDILGLQMAGGPVVLALGAILALTLVLSRGGAPGAWSIVMLVLSSVCLAIVFQAMVYLDDQHAGIGAGVYVAMVGGLAAAGGGMLETLRVLKK